MLSGSVALLGDTLHNLADALTAIPLAIAFMLGRRAADPALHLRLGRAEDLAGVVIVVSSRRPPRSPATRRSAGWSSRSDVDHLVVAARRC